MVFTLRPDYSELSGAYCLVYPYSRVFQGYLWNDRNTGENLPQRVGKYKGWHKKSPRLRVGERGHDVILAGAVVLI